MRFCNGDAQLRVGNPENREQLICSCGVLRDVRYWCGNGLQQGSKRRKIRKGFRIRFCFKQNIPLSEAFIRYGVVIHTGWVVKKDLLLFLWLAEVLLFCLFHSITRRSNQFMCCYQTALHLGSFDPEARCFRFFPRASTFTDKSVLA